MVEYMNVYGWGPRVPLQIVERNGHVEEEIHVATFRHRLLKKTMSGLSCTVSIYSGMSLHREVLQWLDQIQLLTFLWILLSSRKESTAWMFVRWGFRHLIEGHLQRSGQRANRLVWITLWKYLSISIDYKGNVRQLCFKLNLKYITWNKSRHLYFWLPI